MNRFTKLSTIYLDYESGKKTFTKKLYLFTQRTAPYYENGSISSEDNFNKN